MLLHAFGEVEHALFHIIFGFDFIRPSLAHINVAGRAGACPAAIRINSGNHIGHRRFHNGLTGFRLHITTTAGVIDENDFGHNGSYNCLRRYIGVFLSVASG